MPTSHTRSIDAARTNCAGGFAHVPGIDFDFSFAFQPIVDAERQEIVSFEALVRGARGEASSQVFAHVPRSQLHRFDQVCREKAIHLAASLNIRTRLNLNFVANSSRHTRRSIRSTLEASHEEGFPVDNLVFEVSEAERIHHYARVGQAFKSYGGRQFRTAIDDFGTGFSGLRMLAEYQPDYVKLDRNLIADVHMTRVKQILLRGMLGICRELSMEPIAEGVEKAGEYHWLRQAGVRLFQGFYFSKPVFEALVDVRPALFN
jgi:EAL domain-containing protein (putative c-di-GMP-specific phosphodiesterase class I)